MKLFVAKGRREACWTLAVGLVSCKSLPPVLQNHPPRLKHPEATVSTALGGLAAPWEDPDPAKLLV